MTKEVILVAKNAAHYFGITYMTNGEIYAWALPAQVVAAQAESQDTYEGDAAEALAASMPISEMIYVPKIVHGWQQEDIIDWMYPHLMVGELTTY